MRTERLRAVFPALYALFAAILIATVAIQDHAQLDAIWGYGIVLLLAFSALAIGDIVIELLGMSGPPAERLCFSLAAGLIPFWLAPLLLARLGILRPVWLLAIVSPLGVVAIVWSRRRLVLLLRGIEWHGNDWVSAAIGLLLCIYFLHTLLPAMFFDGLAYHLAVPSQYLITGKLLFIPFTQGANYPMGAEFLALYGLAAGDDGALKKINFLFLVLLVVFVGSVLSRNRQGRWAQLVLLASPLTGFLATLEFIDLPLVVYLIFCVYSLMRMHEPSRGHIRAAGIWAGAAMSIKYSAIPFLGVAAAVWLIRSRHTIGRAVRPAAVAFLLSILIPLPWYLKSYAHTGNPVFPYLNRVFESQYVAAHSSAEDDVHGYRKDRSRFSPFHMIRYPFEVSTQKYRGGMLADLGLLYLILLPLLAVAPPRNTTEKEALFYAALFLVLWWVLTGYLIRYAAIAFPLIAISLGRAIEEVAEKGGWLRRLAFTVIALATALNIALYLGQMNTFFKSLTYLTGGMTRDELLRATVTYYPAAVYANDNLSADAHILFVGERRSFHFRQQCTVTNYFIPNPLVTILDRQEDPAGARDSLIRQGFTHLLLYRKHLPDVADSYPISIPGAAVSPIQEFCATLPPIYADGYYVLYRL
ncbi:MAG: glycosyltransferase family 39 protein [Acidobacteria bacterium]|nr:glycosyltransferase family 39 protein [Acidobacteriota bacterium]